MSILQSLVGCIFLLYRDLLERDHKRNIDSYKFKMKPSENFTSARRAQLTWESVTRYLFICVGTRVGGTWWSEWGVTEQLQDFSEKFLMQFLGNLQTPSLCMIMNWTRAGLTTLNISFTRHVNFCSEPGEPFNFFSIDCLSLRLQARGIFGSFSGHHMRTAFEFYNSVIIIIRILKTVILASYNGEKSYKVE